MKKELYTIRPASISSAIYVPTTTKAKRSRYIGREFQQVLTCSTIRSLSALQKKKIKTDHCGRRRKRVIPTELPIAVAHVVNVDGQDEAAGQVEHCEGYFEVELVVNGRPGPQQHNQGEEDVGHVGLDIDIGVTGVVQLERAQCRYDVHKSRVCDK